MDVDMISMMTMMHMEKFPELSESLYTTTPTTTTTVPTIFNAPLAPPCLIDPPPSNIVNFPIQQQTVAFKNPRHCSSSREMKSSSMAAMREMIFRIAVMQPVHIDPEAVKAPKRRNVKISKDPQSVAARHRRERISERIRILQRLVPGSTKMDTASMLDEAVHYVKFLKKLVQTLEQAEASRITRTLGGGFSSSNNNGNNGFSVFPFQNQSPSSLASSSQSLSPSPPLPSVPAEILLHLLPSFNSSFPSTDTLTTFTEIRSFYLFPSEIDIRPSLAVDLLFSVGRGALAAAIMFSSCYEFRRLLPRR
ncbi:hypothetical protein PIB30_012769 [Stylosanthes scabra]|uniref:BHLH domain-containing protein n=1 Tax=Stylosanthes scabra TaxID=79078 RepID=A0ABU6S6N8_9FABA|nr:hypothetical protein [Stylosanthes scabra]